MEFSVSLYIRFNAAVTTSESSFTEQLGFIIFALVGILCKLRVQRILGFLCIS